MWGVCQFNRPADKQENSSASPFAEFMRERLELDREKFRLENSEEAKTRAKVQLIRELASASGDNDYLRYDLVKYSANLIADRKF